MLQAVAFSSSTLVRMPIFLSPIVIVSTLFKKTLYTLVFHIIKLSKYKMLFASLSATKTPKEASKAVQINT